MRRTTIRITAAGAVAAGAAIALLSGCSSSDSSDAAPSVAPKVSPPQILQAGQLKVCTSNDGTPPGVFRDETGKLVGSEVDMAKAVAAQMGLTPEFVESSFAALIPTLQAKQCDVIMAQLYIKPEREKVVDFVPYVYSGTGIAVSKKDPASITGLDDSLCGMKVMVALGTTAESLAEEQSQKCTAAGHKAVNINRNSNSSVAIQQVQNGQMDAYMDTAETIGYYTTKTSAQIKLTGQPFGTIRIGAATLKGNTGLHDAIANAVTEMEKNGSYAKILDRWGQQKLSIVKGADG